MKRISTAKIITASLISLLLIFAVICGAGQKDGLINRGQAAQEKDSRTRLKDNDTVGAISKIDLAAGAEMSFADIAPGEFEMGSKVVSNETPIHKVRISHGFQMQTTEVTQSQWKAMMGSLPSSFCEAGKLEGDLLVDDKPIVCISWNEAQMFVRKLNLRKDSYKYRLPTEAEWEYAARAGTTTKYSSGESENSLDSYAWYRENSEKTIHEVATRQPNAWGLYDMHGNAWEWVQDWYSPDYYSKSPGVDPKGPKTGFFRLSRGGGWESTARKCRSANRYYMGANYRRASIGFRLVRTGR